MKNKSKFEKQCDEVAAKTGVDFYIPWTDEVMKLDVHEDDGNLHIHKRGVHACFDVGKGQSLCGKEQNERTRAVLMALNLAKHIGPKSLMEEADPNDEDDICPCCERPL